MKKDFVTGHCIASIKAAMSVDLISFNGGDSTGLWLFEPEIISGLFMLIYF